MLWPRLAPLRAVVTPAENTVVRCTLRRQRSDVIYSLNGEQLANLLEADLSLSTRNHCANSFAIDSMALDRHLVGNPETLKQLGGYIDAANAGRVRNGFRFQKRPFQRLDRTDVRFGRA